MKIGKLIINPGQLYPRNQRTGKLLSLFFRFWISQGVIFSSTILKFGFRDAFGFWGEDQAVKKHP